MRGLQFNPHAGSQHLLASGGADSKMFVVDMNNVTAPNAYSPIMQGVNTHTAEITKYVFGLPAKTTGLILFSASHGTLRFPIFLPRVLKMVKLLCGTSDRRSRGVY